jgi:hypothetical protein
MSIPKDSPSMDEIDLEPDAWRRFERAVDTVSKSGPQHRTSAKEPSKEPKAASENKGGSATKPNLQR